MEKRHTQQWATIPLGLIVFAFLLFAFSRPIDRRSPGTASHDDGGRVEGSAGTDNAEGQSKEEDAAAQGAQTAQQPPQSTTEDKEADEAVPEDSSQEEAEPLPPVKGGTRMVAMGDRQSLPKETDEDTAVPSVQPGTPYSGRGGTNRGGRARKLGGSAESEDAVELALAWFAKVQSQNGSWHKGSKLPTPAQTGSRPVGVTGLGVLCFLGAGYTHKSGDYADTVRDALQFLLRQQKTNGAFKCNSFYGQGIAAMAVCEAYGMTKGPDLKRAATRATEFIIENMGDNGGFGYEGPGDDIHVTSFQVMALKSAKLAGIRADGMANALRRLRQYYKTARSRQEGTTGYRSTSTTRNKHTAHTALGLFCPVFLGENPRSEQLQKVRAVLEHVGPQITDAYQTYYGTYAMFQLQGSAWDKWNRAFRDPVIARQISSGANKGAWRVQHQFHDHSMACKTAMRVMSLEVYYRFLPVNTPNSF